MPIKVACKCGQSFTAKDELAGQTLLCPKCHEPLTIGQPAGAAAEGGAAAQAGLLGLLDEVGLTEVKGPRCPQCGGGVTSGAVLCVRCGFNLQTGESVAAADVRGGVEDGFQEAAASILSRAANQIDQDVVDDKRIRNAGTPAWMLFLMLCIVVGFAATMYLLPRHTAFFVTGVGLLSFGGIIQLVSTVRILIVAFRDRVLYGVLSIFVPFYILIYCIVRWSRCRRFFMTALGGGLAQLVGWGMIAVSPSLEPEETARFAPLPPPSRMVAAAPFGLPSLAPAQAERESAR